LQPSREDWIKDLLDFAALLCRDCGWDISAKDRRAIVTSAVARYWPATSRPLLVSIRSEAREFNAWRAAHRPYARPQAGIGLEAMAA
jgi:hypothetical protein